MRRKRKRSDKLSSQPDPASAVPRLRSPTINRIKRLQNTNYHALHGSLSTVSRVLFLPASLFDVHARVAVRPRRESAGGNGRRLGRWARDQTRTHDRTQPHHTTRLLTSPTARDLTLLFFSLARSLAAMKIFTLDPAGYVGRSLAQRVVEQGHQVVGPTKVRTRTQGRHRTREKEEVERGMYEHVINRLLPLACVPGVPVGCEHHGGD